jgi:fibronectin type 3 domain-containing protein
MNGRISAIRRFFAGCFAVSVLFVIACGGGGGGGGKAADPITLNAPDKVSASDGAGDSITVSWSEIAGASQYKVYRSESIDGTYSMIASRAGSILSYSDTDVTLQKDYYYRVSTVSSTNTEGLKSNADSGYADTKGGITSLSASNGLYDSKIVLSWGVDKKGSYTYKVFRSDSGSAGTYTLIAEPSSTNYEDTSSLVAGKEYFYKVQGVSSKGLSGDMSNYDNGYIPFTAPTGLSVTKGTDLSKVALSWTAVTGASRYNVYRSETDGSFSATLGSPTAASYSDTGAVEGTTYYYIVEAVSGDGISSKKTASVSGYKGITVPANVTASSGTSYSKVKVSWTAVAGASSYKIYRSVNGGAYSTTAYTSTTNSYSDGDSLSSGKTYSYKVSAMKNSNESALSSASNSGSVLAAGASRPVTVKWTANREKAVNRTGGGYKVEYSTASDFSGASVVDVPYVSGVSAPVSATVNVTAPGTYRIRVRAYSNIGGTTYGSYSSAGSIVIE